MTDKLEKAQQALALHRSGFPNSDWMLMWDKHLKMFTVVSRIYLEEFNPDYIIPLSEK